MKVLRIDLQTEDRSIFKDKEDLRKSLINLHWDEIKSVYGESWGYNKKQQKQAMKRFKHITLNQLCCEFDWDYEIITDKQAKEYA